MSNLVEHGWCPNGWCPKCGKSSSMAAWDEATLAKCPNRKTRRSYKSLMNSDKAAISKRVYHCPQCKEWAFGHQIQQTSMHPQEKLAAQAHASGGDIDYRALELRIAAGLSGYED